MYAIIKQSRPAAAVMTGREFNETLLKLEKRYRRSTDLKDQRRTNQHMQINNGLLTLQVDGFEKSMYGTGCGCVYVFVWLLVCVVSIVYLSLIVVFTKCFVIVIFLC